MRVNEDPSMPNEEEDDEDSLFGSPPPPLSRGRSTSMLALPGGSGIETHSSGNGSGCSTQNVGTIALPGSQLYSELPVNPLALSLSHACQGRAPRPPAPNQPMPRSRPQPAPMPLLTTHMPTPSPASSRASSMDPTTKNKAKVTARSEPGASRSASSSISLPDPSIPPPRNFLRNQSALLGTAGVVGGLKPSNLSAQRCTRGTSLANPIVVDDAPTLGLKRNSRQSSLPVIDPGLLPAPSNEEIVASLIRQKDIFPVLGSILRLIVAGSNTPTSQGQSARPPETSGSGWRRSSRSPIPTPVVRESSNNPEENPFKRRKLNRVPAGATDWDVPYPFKDGEGPRAYRTTWERERGKQLISQLVGLIKTAARKAATRNYLQQEEMKKSLEGQQPTASNKDPQSQPKVKGHYRPITVTYGLDEEAASIARQQIKEMLADASGAGSKPSAQDLHLVADGSSSGVEAGTTNAQSTASFDQLVTSVLATVPEQGGTTTDANSGAGQTDTSTAADQTGFDQALFDNWMSILQTFPMPEEGFTQGQGDNEAHNQPLQSPAPMPSSSSTHTDSVAFDVNSAFEFNVGTLSTSTSSTASSAAECSMATNDNLMQDKQDARDIMDVGSGTNVGSDEMSSLNTASAPYPEFSIDPALLAISIPQPRHASSLDSRTYDTATHPPSLVPSPIPSASSLADLAPMTPGSIGCDVGTPEIYSVSGISEDGGLYRGGRDAGGGDGEGDAANVLLELSGGLDKHKGGKKEVMSHTRSATIQIPVPPTSAGTVTPAPAPARPDAISHKEDILKRAKEWRKQLSDEIASARIELWETTIEQGVLAQLEKQIS